MIRSWLRRILPAPVGHRLRKLYYPFVLRRFPEAKWPPASAVRALLKPGDEVVDAGANIGYVTRLLSEWVGPGGRIFSFEPVPETFDLLAHNVKALGLSNVRLYPFALAAADGHVEMEIPDYADGGENRYEARVIPAGQGGRGRCVTVETRRLDSVLAGEAQRVRLVKVDVEGFELEVVLGASALIAASHPALIVEVSGDPAETGTKPARLFGVLKDHGYKPFLLEDGRLVPHHGGGRSNDVFFLTPVHTDALGELMRLG